MAAAALAFSASSDSPDGDAMTLEKTQVRSSTWPSGTKVRSRTG